MTANNKGSFNYHIIFLSFNKFLIEIYKRKLCVLQSVANRHSSTFIVLFHKF